MTSILILTLSVPFGLSLAMGRLDPICPSSKRSRVTNPKVEGQVGRAFVPQRDEETLLIGTQGR